MDNQEKNYIDYKPTVQPYTIPRVLGVKEIAKEFHIPVTQVRRWINEGRLPVIVCGKRYLVNCTVFSRFLEGQCQPPVIAPTQPPVAIGANGELYSADSRHKGKIKPIF